MISHETCELPDCQIAVMNVDGTHPRDPTNDTTMSTNEMDWQAHAH